MEREDETANSFRRIQEPRLAKARGQKACACNQWFEAADV